MKHEGSLIAVAMLTSYLKSNQDYIDLLTPFVMKSLPKKKETSINLDEIKKKMVDEYGFSDIPINLIRKILDRIKRQKNSLLYSKNGEYILKEIYDSASFDKNKNDIQNNIDIVMQHLARYINTNTFRNKVTVTEARSIFINFMEYYGYSVIADVDNLREITNAEKQNYHVARFIIEEVKADTSIYRSIIEIVKGFLVYKSIHYFSEDKKKTINSKLNKTDIFMDTKLLLSILGYSTPEDTQSSRELLKLVLESGGIAKIFKHTQFEIAGILTRYAKDPYARATMSLDFFDINKYDEIDVLRHRDALEVNINKLGISIVDVPSRNVTTDDDLTDRGFIDETALKEQLISAYSRNTKYLNEDGINRDIDSISAISRLRGKEKQCYIEDCKAIFVTPNYTINHVVNNFFSDRISKREMSFVISEIDLTSLLWLRCFNEKSSLPKMKLLENAYSALKPTNELLRVFEEKVNILVKEDRITPDEAIILRTQSSVAKSLVHETQNNPEGINDELILSIKKKYADTLTKEQDTKILKLSNEVNDEKKKKTRAINNTEVECIQKSERHYKILVGAVKFIAVLLFLGSVILVTMYTEGIFLTILSLFGLYDLFFSKISGIKSLLIKLKKRKFDQLYNTEILRIEKLFS